MCKRFLFFSLYFVALLLVPAALPAQEPEYWYLITETELRSIEEYKRNSEAEKQSWLLQVQRLSMRAGSLEAESVNLNDQLQTQRELNQKLTLSFDEYEAGQSLLMSQKDTQILKLETENKGKDKIIVRLIIVAVLLGAGIVSLIVMKIVKA
jgi:hypothetical protein